MNDVRPPLSPAVAAIRKAVRAALAPLVVGAPGPSDRPDGRADVVVALSGGPDSLALAAAVAFEAPKLGLAACAVIVDHGLQPDSAAVAARAAQQARDLGLSPVVVAAEVGTDGGPEAAARDARYIALDLARAGVDARAILLGHTLDDQAETVLLGLARGSGAGSLQGMAPITGMLVRPLLGVRRSTTREACAAAGLQPWTDPQNTDPAFARVRVRERVLPVLEDELGPGIAEALARTADAAREDAEAFEEMIEETIEEVVEHAEAGISVSAAALAANPAALRQRIIRYIVQSEFGVSLTRVQTIEVARLVTDWSGQGAVSLPSCSATRRDGRIVFTARD
ncbi:MAG TPA: tRNA lysidine(34) synthetase TilS [Plantibacter sp.]|uniref:tRNA lysidine(34) synthetase TilS n=1 Tax=unclassified Plantibacter TaxID=2624265 RepID=UPI002C216869|nr:tRNA lysidine(34) synthetase TilS [Plantibacter sp.]